MGNDDRDDSTEKGFSFSNVKEFDRHISQSIVGYAGLVSDIISVSEYFVESGTQVYDLGCSTGKLVKTLAHKYPDLVIHGIENELNFKEHLSTKDNAVFHFKDVFDCDIRNTNFVTSVFTLQFLPIQDRKKLLEKIYSSMNKGGAFVLCEKMLAGDSKFQDMLSFMYYDHKRQHFTDTAILEKEKSLRSIMKLLTLKEYVDMLHSVGFSRVEIFWRRYIFTGVIAIK